MNDRKAMVFFLTGHRDVNQIYKYIQNQEEHHQKQSFRQEYEALLKEFEISYEELYIFQDLI